MNLTPKQKVFVDEYLIDLNATRAYKIAYPSCKKEETAAQAGSRMLRNVKVMEYIDKRMKDRSIRTEITQDRVLRELASVGFSNGSDFAKVVSKSYMKPIYNDAKEEIGQEEVFYKTVEMAITDDIDKNKLPAIAGIKSTKEGIEVKMNDKVKALELMGRHLGMFNDKLEVTGNMVIFNGEKDLED